MAVALADKENADIVIGIAVRDPDGTNFSPYTFDNPSLAQVAGHCLNSIFLDSLEVDLERLQREATLGQRRQRVALRQTGGLHGSPPKILRQLHWQRHCYSSG